ncbi:MAG TPA: hypothetical protein VME46_00935 [Acidimicrobiales bacterium]|nr:hypothetical protein [Acidimicrobiales bacterium]
MPEVEGRRSHKLVPLLAAGVGVLAIAALLVVITLHSGHLTPTSAPSPSKPAQGPVTSPPTVRTKGRGTTPPRTTKNAGTVHHARASAKRRAPLISPEAAAEPALNLAVPVGFGPVLRRAWVAGDPGGVHLRADEVQSTAPGTVFYAEQAKLSLHWAISSFLPTARAEALSTTPTGKALLAEFGRIAVFVKTPGRPWALLASTPAGTCAKAVPAPVYRAWGICASSRD